MCSLATRTLNLSYLSQPKYRLGSSYKPVKNIDVVNSTAVPPRFQKRQSDTSEMITEIIQLSLLPHCQHVTLSEKNVTNVARKQGVWLYTLQHNGIAHTAVWTIDRYHLQRGPIGQLPIVI